MGEDMTQVAWALAGALDQTSTQEAPMGEREELLVNELYSAIYKANGSTMNDGDAVKAALRGYLSRAQGRLNPSGAGRFATIMRDLQRWREADHEDNLVLYRSAVIDIIEGVAALSAPVAGATYTREDLERYRNCPNELEPEDCKAVCGEKCSGRPEVASTERADD